MYISFISVTNRAARTFVKTSPFVFF